MEKIDDSNYELWLLRYAEQELTSEEREEVEQWLAGHPEAAEELTLYNEAPRLEQDETVRCTTLPQRHTLPLWPAVLRWSAAAAVVALLMLPVEKMTVTPAPKTQPMQVAAVTEVTPEEIYEEEAPAVVQQKAPRCKMEPESQLVAEEVPMQQDTLAEEAPRQQELKQEPTVLYSNSLIVYEPTQDTIYTDQLVLYDNSRRSWTEDVKEWASEMQVVQWVRRRIKVRESELLSMNSEY